MPIEGPPCTPFVPAQCPLFASPMRTQGVNARPHARRATPRIAAREGAAPALAARAGAAHARAARAGAAPARAARACAAHARAAHDRVARAGAAHDRAVLAHPRPTCAPRMPMRAPMPAQHT